MKGKLLILFLFAVLLAGQVFGYNANNPYTVTMNFIIGEDTSFTVQLAGTATSIDFRPADMNSKNVEPDQQNAGQNIPMAIVTNTGNVNQNFRHSTTTALPSWVVVCWNTANTPDWTKLLSNTPQTFATNIPPGSSVNLFFWANFTNAPPGLYDRTYKIESTIS